MNERQLNYYTSISTITCKIIKMSIVKYQKVSDAKELKKSTIQII